MVTLQKYDDGTEFTLKHFGIATVAGALLGTAAFMGKQKLEKISMRRYMKRHDWPQEIIDRY